MRHKPALLALNVKSAPFGVRFFSSMAIISHIELKKRLVLP